MPMLQLNYTISSWHFEQPTLYVLSFNLLYLFPFRVKYGNELTLDAFEKSYDPDIDPELRGYDDEISFVWLCRRDCENYPVYDEWWNITTPMSETCDKYHIEDVGCFWDDGYNSSG